jgi:dynein heavy chain
VFLAANLQTWKQTLWSDIKTEEMEEGAKNFVKEVKALPKRVRLSCKWNNIDAWELGM